MTPASVRVPVATLWAAPSKTRPCDAPALRDDPDIGAWIAAMTPDEQTGGDVVTQLLLGDGVLVEQSLPDGWSRVVAPGQHDYPGWVRTAHLAPAIAAPGSVARSAPGSAVGSVARSAAGFAVVDAVSTALVVSPGGPVAIDGVVLGTELAPGSPVDGWRPVHGPLWIRDTDVVPVPPRAPTGDEVVALARRLLGATYVWGGLSPLGLDCSGLVHLVWRRLGVRLPRDAHQQQAATTPVPPGEERPGDLYFFAHPGRPAHHVGIVVTPAGTGPGTMIHASPRRHRAVEEPLSSDRTNTLAGARRP